MQESSLPGRDAGLMEIDPALDPRLDQLTRRTLLGRAGLGAAGALTATVLGSAASQEKKPRALDDETLHKSEITYPAGEGDSRADIKAFLVSPAGEGKCGGILVIQEIFGLNDHIRDVACRLAQAGYTALAPELFTREGPPPPLSGGFGPMKAFIGKIPDSQVLGDLKAGMALLRARPDSNGKVGSVGFCWGGRISMLLDAAAPDLNAAVAYYGRISGDKTANQPAYPLDMVAQMHAPLLGHFGEKDTGIPPSEAEKLRAALRANHKTAEIYVYEGAGHAFNNDTRESYEPKAAALAWKRTLAWFDTYVGKR